MFSVLGAGRRGCAHRGRFPALPAARALSHCARQESARGGKQLPSAAPLPPTAAAMQGDKVWLLLASVLLCPLVQHQGGLEGVRVNKRPAVSRVRNCADRPEELLEPLYGRLMAGMLSAFHHTLQLEPFGKENISCPAGRRGPADKKHRLPINLHSVSPWAYRISYDPARYPKYIPEAYCLCKGCLNGISGEEDLHFRSTLVYMPTVILRRTSTCVGGRYIYVEDYVTVSVGCTCVPEQVKGPEAVNSSIDKDELKLSVNKNDKPASP